MADLLLAGHVTAATVRAFSVDPLTWLGSGASAAASDVWTAAMTALWSAGVWILQLAYRVIDTVATPDLSAHGPLGAIYPYTFYLGGLVAALTGFLQLGTALWRRDGRSIARILVGFGQFALVWAGSVTVAALLVSAAAGLTSGLLQGLLHVDTFSAYSASASWPRQTGDAVTATVLGVCTIFVIFPAAIGYILVMLVREAALLLLVATSPISAAGLMNENTRAWFWKSLRWFIAALLVAPTAALVVGVGTKISQGVVSGAGDQTGAAVGMAVVGAVLALIGAVSPLVLFRLLAFVDPGTASGASMRQSFDAAGGLSGLLGGGSAPAGNGGSAPAGNGASAPAGNGGSGAATSQLAGGQSQGEASAATATASRFGAAFGPAGAAFTKGTAFAGAVAGKAAAISTDVLGAAGIGHPAPHPSQAGAPGTVRPAPPASHTPAAGDAPRPGLAPATLTPAPDPAGSPDGPPEAAA